MINNFEHKFESLDFYERLFTFISIKGKEPLIQFFKDIEEIMEQKTDEIILQSLFGKSAINELYERNRFIVSFFMDCGLSDLEAIIDKKNDFSNFLRFFKEEHLNTSIDNIKILEQLGINKVYLTLSPGYAASMNNLVYVYKDDKSIKKNYSDVEISYSDGCEFKDGIETYARYRPKYGNDFGISPSWVIITDNKWDDGNDRCIYLRDFNFDANEFPSLDELDTYNGGLKKEPIRSFVYTSLPLVSGK